MIKLTPVKRKICKYHKRQKFSRTFASNNFQLKTNMHFSIELLDIALLRRVISSSQKPSV